MPTRSLLVWTRKFIEAFRIQHARRRRGAVKPRAEALEDRVNPGGGPDLGMAAPAAPGTFWQTLEHDDMRTGASTVSALITSPTALWNSDIGPVAGGDGSPAEGISGVLTASAADSYFSVDDASGATLGSIGNVSGTM